MKLAEKALELVYQYFIDTIMEKARTGRQTLAAVSHTEATYELLKGRLKKEGFSVSEVTYNGSYYEYTISW